MAEITTDRVFFKTYGCQMNEHDSQQMLFILKKIGYRVTDEAEQASLIIINTCSVREGPENKLYSYLGRLRKIKQKRPHLLIGVGGCVAQQEKRTIIRRAPWVDMVFGPDNYIDLPHMLKEASQGNQQLRVKFHKNFESLLRPILQTDEANAALRVKSAKAYISITKGCDNFCSFCIVPFTRGRESSLSTESILAEAKRLILLGAKEITLVGQNVNSYKYQGDNFYTLLDKISQLKGLERIRFVSPHPKDWNDDLSALMADRSNICNQLHLPFQSGSSRILKLMRRDHDIESYKQKIANLKRLIPDISLSTDVIVGFPSETEQDFVATMDVLREVGFLQVFAFKYSPRPGTRAAKMEDDVPLALKEERLARLLDWQRGFITDRLKHMIGQKASILVDNVSANTSQSSGKSQAGITVKVNNTLQIGAIVDLKITDCHQTSLIGTIL